MDNETIVWIVVGIIALLALLALALAAARKKKAQRETHRRYEAQQVRTEARKHVDNVGQAKVGAAEAEARAERARLEAEEARREAEAARGTLAAEQEEYEQRLREADRLDPDVDHKAKDYRPTEPDTHTAAPTDDGIHGASEDGRHTR